MIQLRNISMSLLIIQGWFFATRLVLPCLPEAGPQKFGLPPCRVRAVMSIHPNTRPRPVFRTHQARWNFIYTIASGHNNEIAVHHLKQLFAYLVTSGKQMVCNNALRQMSFSLVGQGKHLQETCCETVQSLRRHSPKHRHAARIATVTEADLEADTQSLAKNAKNATAEMPTCSIHTITEFVCYFHWPTVK